MLNETTTETEDILINTSRITNVESRLNNSPTILVETKIHSEAEKCKGNDKVLSLEYKMITRYQEKEYSLRTAKKWPKRGKRLQTQNITKCEKQMEYTWISYTCTK